MHLMLAMDIKHQIVFSKTKCHFDIPLLSRCIAESLLPLLQRKDLGDNTLCFERAISHVFKNMRISIGGEM